MDKQEFNRSKQFPSPPRPQPAGGRAGKQQQPTLANKKTDDRRERDEESKEEVTPASSNGGASDDSSSSPAASVASVEFLMDAEFARIIGHDSIKAQLRQFHKKVQLDRIRAAHGKERDTKRLYHMIFSGPPGTGQPPSNHSLTHSVSQY